MSLPEPLGTVASGAPFLLLLVGSGLAALALSIMMLALGARRLMRTQRLQRAALLGDWQPAGAAGPPSRLLELCVPISPLLVVTASVLAVQRSRSLILQGVASADLGHKGKLLSQGLEGELTSIPIGLLCAALPTLLGCLAYGLATSARLQTAGLFRGADLAVRDPAAASAWATYPGPRAPVVISAVLGFVLLGAAPIAWAAFSATIMKLERFVGVAAVEPGLKAASFEEAERAARSVLERGLLLAFVGGLAAVVLAGTLLWATSPERARRRMLGRTASQPESRGDAAVAVCALAAAGALLLVARPIKRENEMPWPPGEANHGFGVETPQFNGPDVIERGPMLEVTREQTSVDGVPEDAEGLVDRLRVQRDNFAILHPSEAFPARVLLLCAPDAPAARVFEALGGATRAGYRSVTFVFEKRSEMERPILGTIKLRHGTGARATLLDTKEAASPETVFVHPTDAPTCAGISEHITSARQRKREVVLIVRDAASAAPQP